MKSTIPIWESGLFIITAILTLAIAEAPTLIQWIQPKPTEVTEGAIAPHSSLGSDRTTQSFSISLTL